MCILSEPNVLFYFLNAQVAAVSKVVFDMYVYVLESMNSLSQRLQIQCQETFLRLSLLRFRIFMSMVIKGLGKGTNAK